MPRKRVGTHERDLPEDTIDLKHCVVLVENAFATGD